MKQTNFYNKISVFFLIVFVLNLFFWNLLITKEALAVSQARYSCDSATKECYRDDENGEYTCKILCNNKCSGESPSSVDPLPLNPGCGCGGGEAQPVYIVGSVEQSAAQTEAARNIKTLQDLADISGITTDLLDEVEDVIITGKNIPEKLQGYFNKIKDKSNFSVTDKNILGNAISQGLPIPENLRSDFLEAAIQFGDISDLVQDKFLDLLGVGLDVDWICGMLSNAATALPWGLGVPVSMAIGAACPIILKELLASLGAYSTKQTTEELVQTIPVPTFRFFQWEVGLPGFFQPGQILKFK